MFCKVDLMVSAVDAQGDDYCGGVLSSASAEFELWELQGQGSKDQRDKDHRFDVRLGLILELVILETAVV